MHWQLLIGQKNSSLESYLFNEIIVNNSMGDEDVQ